MIAGSEKKNLLIVQRVLTRYRYELLKELSPYFKTIQIASSKGEERGTLKLYLPTKTKSEYENVIITILKSIRIPYSGDSRSSSMFFFPGFLGLLIKSDIVLTEGTTNILNNILLIPAAKLLGKKVIWWDSGYSPERRTIRRKLIDSVISVLVRLTDTQIAYSTKGGEYMKKYMGARKCHVLVNTINTSYFQKVSDEIDKVAESYVFDPTNIKLLYVGVVEPRKKVKELIDIVHNLNKKRINRQYFLTVVGGGDQLNELRDYIKTNEILNIRLIGPVYDQDELKQFYFKADFFVLPGDGGLGILQSILYGLPVITVPADGTEEDYLPKHNIAASISEIEKRLVEVEESSKYRYKDIAHFSHVNWINGFLKII